jgi:hypothetical protein
MPRFFLALAALFACGAGTNPLAGDSLCVGFSDGGQPQASVNAGGIVITIPLSALRRFDGGAELAPSPSQ